MSACLIVYIALHCAGLMAVVPIARRFRMITPDDTKSADTAALFMGVGGPAAWALIVIAAGVGVWTSVWAWALRKIESRLSNRGE